MSAHTLNNAAAIPWYRQPWLWFVASWPIAAIVAGTITIYIAFSGADGLVADDYYKRGMAINRELTRDRAASTLALRADGRHDPDRETLTIALSASDAVRWPPALTLRIIHPTHAQGDRQVALAATGNGVYVANLASMTGPKRRLIVESEAWRVSGEWTIASEREFHLQARPIE